MEKRLVDVLQQDSIEAILEVLRPHDILDELPLQHYKGDNLYVREAHYPKGAIVVGRVHKYNHVFILVTGKVTIWTEEGRRTLTAPAVIETPTGTQRVGYFHANSMCINCHGHNEEHIEDNKEFFTTETKKQYLEFKEPDVIDLPSSETIHHKKLLIGGAD